jgi:UDP-2,4-diacetamido-2,4,6-trideoxy-beta-L-altropyranose hydrolase
LNIFFRTDSSTQIGSGHLVRCTRLAYKLKYLGHNVEFISKNLEGNLIDKIEKDFKVNILYKQSNAADDDNYIKWLGSSVKKDLSQTLSIINNKKADIVFLDNYALDYIWEKEISKKVKKLVVIDDIWDKNHFCDVLINHNFTLSKEKYLGIDRNRTKFLDNPSFAMIDENYAKLRSKRNYINSDVDSIFIYFGNTDSFNLTELAAKTLSNKAFDNIKVNILTSKENSKYNKVLSIIDNKTNFTLLKSSPNLANIMSCNDLCIGAGGVSNLERLCLGLPTIVISVADNQLDSCLSYQEEGYIFYLGQAKDITEKILYDKITSVLACPDSLQAQSNKGMKLFDGRGLDRVIKNII